MVAGKYLVIDAHCHIYPEKIAARAVGGTDSFYGEKSLYSGTSCDMLRQGASAGVDRFVVQSVATTPVQVRRINEFIAEQVAGNPGKLTGLGTLHPDSTDIKGDLEYLISLGLRGVKLHPDIQDFKIDDFRCLRIYELCEEYGVPILMHAGDSRFDRSNPNRLYPVMKIYTGLTVVAAHLGGWSVWEEACERLHRLPNLYVDCSSSFPYLPPETVKRIIVSYGTDRVLFGTDYPMWSPEKEIGNLLALGFDDRDNRLILSENAKKVYRME